MIKLEIDCYFENEFDLIDLKDQLEILAVK